VWGSRGGDGHDWLVKGGLVVDDADGLRWDLALELLDEGRDFVIMGKVRMMLGRVGAVPRVHIAV
jgi:hypothetical protein